MKKTTSRTAVLALAGLCGFALAAPLAKANVIYTFTTSKETNNGGSAGVTGTLPLSLTYTLADAIVQAGQFTLNGRGTGAGPTFTSASNTGSFVSLSVSNGSTTEQVLPNFLDGSIQTTLKFNANGSVNEPVSSSILSFAGISESALLIGTGTAANGFVGASSGACTTNATSGICQVSGFWTSSASTSPGGGGGTGPGTGAPVPEPASLALLGFGIIAVGAMRHGAGRRTPA